MRGQSRNPSRRTQDRGVCGAARAETELMRIAARQHGLVTRSQLLCLGMSRDAIDNRVKSRRFRPFRRGIYLLSPTIPPFAPEQAAILSCPRGAVLFGQSAAYLHELLPYPAHPRLVHVAVPGNHPGPKPGIEIHRVPIPPQERMTRHGMPITTPARTILDLGAALDPPALEQVVAEAHRRGMASADNLHALMGCHPRGAGTRALRALLNADHSSAFLRSRAERRLLDLLRKARLPEPEANARLGDLEIDFLWRDRRLAIEVDGASFHTALPDRRRDQVKDAALVRSGHAVLRLGWHQIVDEPEATVALIAQMLAKPRD